MHDKLNMDNLTIDVHAMEISRPAVVIRTAEMIEMACLDSDTPEFSEEI